MSRDRRSTIVLALLLLAFAFGLKWWYSTARLEDLGFMLRPVAELVRAVSNVPFQVDPDRGFLFPGLGIAIDRSCSGINFLVILVATLSLTILKQGNGGCARPLLAALTAGGAYLLAIVVNAGRILTMAWAQHAGLHLSPRGHEAVGALFFLAALALAALLLHRLITRRHVPLPI